MLNLMKIKDMETYFRHIESGVFGNKKILLKLYEYLLSIEEIGCNGREFILYEDDIINIKINTISSFYKGEFLLKYHDNNNRGDIICEFEYNIKNKDLLVQFNNCFIYPSYYSIINDNKEFIGGLFYKIAKNNDDINIEKNFSEYKVNRPEFSIVPKEFQNLYSVDRIEDFINTKRNNTEEILRFNKSPYCSDKTNSKKNTNTTNPEIKYKELIYCIKENIFELLNTDRKIKVISLSDNFILNIIKDSKDNSFNIYINNIIDDNNAERMAEYRFTYSFIEPGMLKIKRTNITINTSPIIEFRNITDRFYLTKSDITEEILLFNDSELEFNTEFYNKDNNSSTPLTDNIDEDICNEFIKCVSKPEAIKLFKNHPMYNELKKKINSEYGENSLLNNCKNPKEINNTFNVDFTRFGRDPRVIEKSKKILNNLAGLNFKELYPNKFIANEILPGENIDLSDSNDIDTACEKPKTKVKVKVIKIEKRRKK